MSDKQVLIDYRLKRAQEAYILAKSAIDQKIWNGAANKLTTQHFILSVLCLQNIPSLRPLILD